MDIQTKDGIVLRGIPEGTPDEAIKARIAKIRAEGAPREPFSAPAQAVAVEPEPKAEPTDLNVGVNAANKAIVGIPDALLNTPNRIMNLGRAAYGVLSPAEGTVLPTGEKMGAPPEPMPDPNYLGRLARHTGVTNEAAEPANARQRVMDAMVQGTVGAAAGPANSVRGLVTNAVTGATGGAAAGATKEATGSDTAAMAASLLAPAVVQAGAGYGRAKVADAELRRSQNEVRDKTLADARKEGYVVPPSEVNPSAVNKILESIAGKAATRQEGSNRNQTATNEVAARDLGFQKGTALTEGKLETYRDQVAGPYREVAAMSPRAAVALEQLKDARYNANVYGKHAAITGDPNSLAKEKALRAKAEGLELLIEKIAVKAGKPDLVDELRAARTQIAKSYDVERALNVGDAGVSAPALGRALDKGKPLSGGLETAGRFAEAFPSVAREGAKVPTPGVSKVAAALAPILGIGGYGVAGPVGLAAAAIPLASGPVRSLILSKPYQSLMAKPDYSPGMKARALKELQQLSPQQQAVQAALIARAIAEQQKEGN